jgi:hypothetical protein
LISARYIETMRTRPSRVNSDGENWNAATWNDRWAPLAAVPSGVWTRINRLMHAR